MSSMLGGVFKYKEKNLGVLTFEVKKKPMFELQEGTPSHEQLQLPQSIFRPS